MKPVSKASHPIGRYMDIRTDHGFKALFGSEPNKDILIEFLNSLLEGRRTIKEIQYRSVEEIGDDQDGKRITYDLRCRGEDGEEFLVELQRSRQTYFKDRIVFYFSRLISRLLRKGKKTKDYKLPEVYVISVVDFRIDDHIRDRYYRTIALADLSSNEVFYDKLFLKWLEIPNFEKGETEIATNIDKWMWLFKNLGKANKMPLFMDTRALRKVFKITEVANLSKEERMAYEASLRHKMEWEGAITYATQEAVRKERERAEKEIERLKAKTIAEKQQAEQNKIRSVERMLLKGLSVTDIAEFSDLTVEQVEEINSALQKTK